MQRKKRQLSGLGKRQPKAPHMLTRSQLEVIRSGWRSGMSLSEIMRQARISKHMLKARLADQLEDLTAATRGRPKLKRGYRWCPSPQEIADEAAKLKAAHLEHFRRYGGSEVECGHADLPATPRDDGSRLPARR